MADTEPDDREEEPLDPAMEAVRRKMVLLQLVSGGIMFVMFMAVLGAIVYKVMGRDEAPAVAASSSVVPGDAPLAVAARLPAGFTVDDVALTGSQILFYGAVPGGTRKAIIFDVTVGRVVGDVTIVTD